MEPQGIKFVDYGKLVNHIFLPEPTRFQVKEYQSIDGVYGVYSIPFPQYKNPKNQCYYWWGRVFKKASAYRIQVEVTLIIDTFLSGFRFHEQESLVEINYTGDPRAEAQKLRKEALAKSKDIQEIQERYKLLKQVIAGTIPLTTVFYNHLIATLGFHDQYVEPQCSRVDLPEFFSVDDYLFHYGRSKGLHLLDLVDAGIIDASVVHYLDELESKIDTDEAAGQI